MMVERDLRAIIVVSGDRRYVIRRPGPVWPLDEHVLADTIDDLAEDLDPVDIGTRGSLPGTVELFRRILDRLHMIGVIDYDEQARTGGL